MGDVQVTVMTAGRINKIDADSFDMAASTTLVKDGNTRILVDTGGAGDTEALLAGTP